MFVSLINTVIWEKFAVGIIYKKKIHGKKFLS